MTNREWEKIKKRLAGSRFRSGFKLNPKDRAYFLARSEEDIREHALNFIRKRLAPAYPINDGKQTPFRGHPVFTAQHATAVCCRKCLEKWHGIRRGHPLSPAETEFVVDLIMRWLDDNHGRITIVK